jgi:phage tail-like protein
MKESEIESLFPLVFQRALRPGGLFQSLLEVMELLHAPAEEALDELEKYFDPYLAPDEFVPYLASWVDLDWLLPVDGGPFPPGVGRLRELLRAAGELSRQRGTRAGLILFLETATGVAGFELIENPPGKDGQPQPFTIQVSVPPDARPYQALIDLIIRVQKPAYIVYQGSAP